MRKQPTKLNFEKGPRSLVQRCRLQAANLVEGAEFLSTVAEKAQDSAWLRGYIYGVERMMSAVAEQSRRSPPRKSQ
jgi:hypothetical protein